MKVIKRIRNWLLGPQDQKLSENDTIEARRVYRRLTKFPKMKGAPNPYAHRTALFKSRYGLSQ